ncbi:MAG: hypothetical protein KIT72_00700 [Polyangiaceae bacterium]|nr:hypothetical protein [Polyangiaceae bacterium]MCW5788914.1 hypothetical protein [Polyangiaceae bacterium]
MAQLTISCQRCGGVLEVPSDPRVLHVVCRYCGASTLLPPALIAAQQRQLEIDAKVQQHQLAIQAKAQAAKHAASSKRLSTLMIGAGVLCFSALIGGSVLYTLYKQHQLDQLAQDPAKSGNAAMLARIAAMQKSGCDRVLTQPKVVSRTEALSYNMIQESHCVHLLGISSLGASLQLKYDTVGVSLMHPLPQAGSSLDYRLCATATAQHSFTIQAFDDRPFTVAAIECPRTVKEGAARSDSEKPETTGELKVKREVDRLYKAGCRTVVTQPTVLKGERQLSYRSKANGACLSVFVASAYDDVKLTAKIVTPEKTLVPVPRPASQVRAVYCPTVEGNYEITLTPSSADHYTQAAVDCPRGGPEGMRRLDELRRPQ